MRQFATDLFNNGSQGKVLKKNSDANMDFGWGEGSGSLPAGGQEGYVLVKHNDGAVWGRPDALYPRMDLVYLSSSEKTVVAKVNRKPIENVLEGRLSASFADGTLTLVISNDSDESLDVYFNLYFDVSGDYEVGAVSSEAVTVVGSAVWNQVEVYTPDIITIAAGETETITIALTEARSVDTNRVYSYEFPDYALQSE